MNTEQERRDFENHFRRKGFTLKREPGGNYRSGYGAEVWAGWQARAALQSQDREDAERYRAMRAAASKNDTDFVDALAEYGRDNFVCFRSPTFDEFDAAIDHARRFEGEQR